MVAFTQELFDYICEAISNGESLTTICAEDDMPNKSTVLRWLDKEDAKELRDQYARAREAQADAIFDECLHIADEGSDDVQKAKLRIDTRKWMAGKLRPKKYADRHQHEHSGPDGEPIKTEIQVTIVDPRGEHS